MSAQEGSIRGDRGRLRVGNWTVDTNSGQCTQGDTSFRFRPKVIKLLLALMEQPGELCSKHDLLSRVWPDVVVSEASLSVLVAELRSAVDDDPAQPAFIETVPLRGYRLIAPSRWLDDGSTCADTSRFALITDDRTIQLCQGENLLGRGTEVHVKIESSRASRLHAKIVVDGNTATIEDLGSKNATFVNGNRLLRTITLVPGDKIRICQAAAEFSFVTTEEQPTVTEAPREISSTANGNNPTISKRDQ